MLGSNNQIGAGYSHRCSHHDHQMDFHVGAGFPHESSKVVHFEDISNSACSSMCSAASTVMSALISFDSSSIAFPVCEAPIPSHFNFQNLNYQPKDVHQGSKRCFTIETYTEDVFRSSDSSNAVPFPKRQRSDRSEYFVRNMPPSHHSVVTDFCKKLEASQLEEFSLGPGNPWQ